MWRSLDAIKGVKGSIRYNRKYVKTGELLTTLKEVWKLFHEDRSYDGLKMWQIGGPDGLVTSGSLFAKYVMVKNVVNFAKSNFWLDYLAIINK